jgi:lincosamide and streptogramin A transport system ATP-binding/permease protein
LLSLDGASLFYGEREACGNVSFELNRRDRLALSGRNGSGKSTILKLICGESIAYTGGVHIGSGLQISYVPQDADRLSGNLRGYAEAEQIDGALFRAILSKLGFSKELFDKEMSDYSAGQKKKVTLARSLCQKAHLYIWDEPLNYIDVYSRMQIEELILVCQPTLLFIEHDRMFCDAIATKTDYLP